jgi:hypothetical protein
MGMVLLFWWLWFGFEACRLRVSLSRTSQCGAADAMEVGVKNGEAPFAVSLARLVHQEDASGGKQLASLKGGPHARSPKF